MTVKTIKHEELKGGYSIGKKIIIDASEVFGEFEVIAMDEEGEELECQTVNTEEEAGKVFDEMLLKYAEPFQKALYKKLESGKKYTLVYLNEFGFPVAEKITFESMRYTTYAQYSDVVEMAFTPYRKRKMYTEFFYNCSLMIFAGWQDMKKEDTHETLKKNESMEITKSKYACFDSRYIEDLEKVFKNPIVIYKNYRSGVDGRIYA